MTGQCEWCGAEHSITALCLSRPKWSRRGFLALASAAIVGAVLPLPTNVIGDTINLRLPLRFSGGVLVTDEWFTREAARMFLNNRTLVANINRDYDARFQVPTR